MSQKILGISASPRGKANSYYLLTKALDSAKEIIRDAKIDIYTFAKKKFAGCNHCYGCRRKGKEGQCVIEDDFQNLAAKWKGADIIIYSVPVYHMSIPGQLKCFIDRLGQSGIAKLTTAPGAYGFVKPLKCMGIISQGMHIFSGQEHAVTELVNHALITGCIPITGNLWQSYIGASGWTECLRDKNAIEKLNKEGTLSAHAAVESAETMGRNVALLAKVISAGKKVVFEQNVLEKAK